MLASFTEFFSSRFFMPHGHCYLWKPALLWLQVLSNALIGTAYVAISATLAYLVFKIRDIPFKAMYLAFGVFIITCGITHFFDVYVIWHPAYWEDGAVRAVTALASVGTALALPPLVPKAIALARGAKAAHDKGIKLETLVRDLGTMYEKTRELDELKTQFFANVSHELRTPLTLILGPIEKMLGSGALGEEARRDLETAARNGRVLLKQVNDLLDVAKLDAGKLAPRYSPIDLAALARLAAANFDALAKERGIAFVIDVPDELVATVDSDKVERVLLNLIGNAFKFTPSAGRIRCRLAREKERVVIDVADSGPGIPTNRREAVFDRFRQLDGGVDRRFGGSGLGLAIARDFVRLQNGDISVDRAPEGGALFRVVLPLAPPPGTPVAPAEPARASNALPVEVPTPPPVERPATGDRAVALLVEDNAEMRSFVADALSADYDVHTAEDGEKGLAAAARLHPDVIVSDVMMPRMSGDRMLAELRSRPELAGIPTIFLTAKAEDELRTRLLRQGAQDYLVKPFSIEELRARVANQATMKRARDILARELAVQTGDVSRLAAALAAERRRLSDALDALRIAHRETERALAAKGDFLTLVSHELKTPLTALDLQLHQLRTKADRPEVQKTAVQRIGEASRRLAVMVDSLLEATRIRSAGIDPNPAEVDLAGLAREVATEYEPQAAAKGLALQVSAPADLPPLVSDERFCRFILSNLVGNAVKFSRAGAIEISLSHEGGRHLLRVSDTGPGIARENLEQIFEPFTHLEPLSGKHTPGFGLGLALVRQIVAGLGGKVSVTSEPGKGSVFTVTLPPLPLPPLPLPNAN